MYLVIDNYDSFVFNLVQYLGELNNNIKVVRNDKTSIKQIKKMSPSFIFISPGPSTPENAGLSIEIIKKFSGKIPILGICLGHQAIGFCFGAKIIRSPEIYHGKTSKIYHDKKTIYKGLKNPFTATRYHSLIIDRKTLPETLEISAFNSKGIIMGIRHRKLNVEGVQFHPESILTNYGKRLIRNFVTNNRKIF